MVADNALVVANSAQIGYFSMEIELDPSIPQYVEGLGVLSGDMLRSAADLGVPIVGVTLIHHKGYFRQRLDGRTLARVRLAKS